MSTDVSGEGGVTDEEAVARAIWMEVVQEEESDERPDGWEDEHPSHQATMRKAARAAIAILQSRRSAAPGGRELGGILPTAFEASMNKEDAPSVIEVPKAFVLFLLKQFNDFCDESPWEGWQEMAELFGFVECIDFDPAVHNDPNGYGLEKGDPFYVLTAAAKAIRTEANKKPSQMAQSNDPARAEAALRECLDAMRADNPAEGWLEIIQRGEAALACSPAPLPTGWRGIASAPKDGTIVIGIHNRRRPNGAWVYRLCKWDELDRWLVFPAGGHYEPTHWMSLPSAPVGSEK